MLKFLLKIDISIAYLFHILHKLAIKYSLKKSNCIHLSLINAILIAF